MKFKPRFLSGPIFSLIILLLFSSIAITANPLPLLRIADNYFKHGNYQASVTEYWRFIYFSNQHPYLFYAYYKAGLAETHLNNREEADAFFRRSEQIAPNRHFRQYIQYQLILNLIYSGKYDIAKIELFKMENNKDSAFFRQISHLYMGVLYLSEKSFTKAGEEFLQVKKSRIINFSAQRKLDKIDSLLNILSANKQKRSSRMAKWLSTFLPGSGQIYAGKVLDGLNALALNTLTSFFLFKTLKKKKYRDAALVSSLLWWRYYDGNRHRAENAAFSANQRNIEKCSIEIFHLLEEMNLKTPDKKVIIEWRNLPKLIK